MEQWVVKLGNLLIPYFTECANFDVGNTSWILFYRDSPYDAVSSVFKA